MERRLPRTKGISEYPTAVSSKSMSQRYVELYGPSSPARGWARPTTTVFYSKLVYTVASIDTQIHE